MVTTDLPLNVGDKVGQVSTVQGIGQVHLVSIVSPGAEGQVTLLHIEGEEGHVHGAGAFRDGRLVPHDLTVVTENNVGFHGAGEFIVRTVEEKVEEVNRGQVVTLCSCECSSRTRSPVVQNDVWFPHVAAGNADGVETVVVVLIPGEVGVHPHLAYPQVGRQDLVALILVKPRTRECNTNIHNRNTCAVRMRYHVDDLGESDLQCDIDDVVGVLHRPQGVGVVGEKVGEQLLSEASVSGPTNYRVTREKSMNLSLAPPSGQTSHLLKGETLSAHESCD